MKNKTKNGYNVNWLLFVLLLMGFLGVAIVVFRGESMTDLPISWRRGRLLWISLFSLLMAAVFFGVQGLDFVVNGIGRILRSREFYTKKYADKKAGFRLEYPADWISAKNASNVLATFEPLQNEGCEAQVKIEIRKTEFATLEKYTEHYLFEEVFAEDGTTEILETESSNIGGHDAHRLMLSRKKNGVEIRSMQAWTMKGGQVYFFNFEAPAESFQKFAANAARIIFSFQFV